MKRGIAVAIAAVLALLGLSPAAFAAVFQPSPPTITMVGSPDQTVPAHPQYFQLSPKPGETGFTVLNYNDQITRDTSADPATFDIGITSAPGLSGTYTGDGSYTQYVRARMNVTLSDGTPYTTDWSSWVKVQPGPSTGPAPGPTPKTVVLGDSFSSGEGVPTFENGTDVTKPKGQQNLCHRSDNAYAHVLQRTGKIDLSAFVACSGATSQNIINTRQYPSQPIQDLSISSDTQLVVLTIGGNDVGFHDLAVACVTTGCITQASTVEARMIYLRKVYLPKAFAEIRKRTNGHARVLVLGYPQELPNPDQVDIRNCKSTRVWPFDGITPAEAKDLRQITSRLDGFIQSAAQEAGFEYVDPNSAFSGHELCTTQPYFNGFQLQNSAFSMHPNALGQGAYARLVAGRLSS